MTQDAKPRTRTFTKRIDTSLKGEPPRHEDTKNINYIFHHEGTKTYQQAIDSGQQAVNN